MSTQFNSSYVSEQGSPYAAWAFCDSTGSVTSATYRFPIIASSQINDTTEETTKSDEGGNSYTLDSTRTPIINVTTLQTDADTMNWATETVKGSTFTFIKQINSTAENSKYKYFIAPICKAKADLVMDAPGREISFQITAQPVPALTTVDVNSFANGATNFGVTVESSSIGFPAGSVYKIVELGTA